VSKVNALTSMLLRSPLLWGGAVAFCFFGMIHAGVIKDANVIRYLAGHWVEYVETAMFAVGMAALVIKWLDLRAQHRHSRDPLLEPIPEGGQDPADARRMGESLPAEDGSYSIRRYRETLDLVMRTGSADGLEDHMKYLSDLDAARAAQSYGLVRFIIWAIPIMGFLGTVIGITEAIANLSPTQLDNISGVVAGLGVAFDTTAIALAMAMVLMIFQFVVDRSEQALLSIVDQEIWTSLAGRFQSVDLDDGSALAITRLGEAVGRSSTKLLEAQEQAWRSLERTATAGLEQVLESAAGHFETSLSQSLDATLSRWSDSLVEAHSRLASSREDRWTHAAEAMAAAMRSFEHHQRALAGQTALIGQVVDAAHNVTLLERSLDANLATLSKTGRFEETLATLAAAVQLLAARAQDVSLEPRRVDLQAAVRSGKAA
jgi:hypothetical protein